jgi:hypothetical protein
VLNALPRVLLHLPPDEPEGGDLAGRPPIRLAARLDRGDRRRRQPRR